LFAIFAKNFGSRRQYSGLEVHELKFVQVERFSVKLTPFFIFDFIRVNVPGLFYQNISLADKIIVIYEVVLYAFPKKDAAGAIIF